MNDDDSISFTLTCDEDHKHYDLIVSATSAMTPKEYLASLQALVDDYADNPAELIADMRPVITTVN